MPYYSRLVHRYSLDDPLVSLNQELEEVLSSFACEGLRTLVIAQRDVSETAARIWLEQYERASTSVGDREAKLAKAAADIEDQLSLLGATAVEDKLQVLQVVCTSTLCQLPCTSKRSFKLWLDTTASCIVACPMLR
jgi:hypothetical protein